VKEKNKPKEKKEPKEKKNKKEKVVKTSSNEKQFSIKLKLLGVIIPVVSIIILVLIFIAYEESNKIITANANKILNLSAKNQVNEIEAWLDENLVSFQAIKTSIENANLSDEQLQTVLDAFNGYNSNYADGLYIADDSGKILAATKSTTHQDEDVKNTVWYQEGLTRINMGYGSAYQNAEGKSVISATGMLLDQSSNIRVISADVTLDRISIIVNSLVSMKDAQAILIDSSNDTILAAREDALISTVLGADGSNELYTNIAKKITDGNLDTAKLNDYIVNFKKISGTNWILVSYVPEKSILSELLDLRTFMIIIGILSVVLLIVLIERVTHLVLKPIKMLTSTIVRMGQGDFSMDVVVKGRDEISLMSKSLKGFIEVMRGMIQDISAISSRLYQQSEGSSQIANQLFDSSTLQSDSMKNLNATVDDLAHSVNEIADNATTLAQFVSETSDEGNKVNKKMAETVDVSEKGKADMEDVRQAMENIETSITNLEAAINKVGNASDEITNIVNLIGNIAEETSLLSLNASIEAARAGDAGKGFAVVASEIGKLSNTSAQAVQNIEKLIAQIVELVADTVHQSKESADYINQSTQKITTATDTFDSIFDSINMTSSLVSDMLEKIGHVDDVATNVAAISQEQAASSEEILATSEEMVNQANAIAESSKNVAQDSKQLEETAKQLGEQVALFKL